MPGIGVNAALAERIAWNEAVARAECVEGNVILSTGRGRWVARSCDVRLDGKRVLVGDHPAVVFQTRRRALEFAEELRGAVRYASGADGASRNAYPIRELDDGAPEVSS